VTFSFWSCFGKSQKYTLVSKVVKDKIIRKKIDKKKLAYLGALVTVLVQLFAKAKEAWKLHYNSF